MKYLRYCWESPIVNSFKYLERNVAFDALEGQCVSILGNNGAGKSTLVKCLNRILKPQAGEVSICGEQAGALSRNEIARRDEQS